MAELPPQPVRLQLFVGPGVADARRRKVVVDALREVTVESGLGRRPRAASSSSSTCRRARRCTRCSCSPAARRIPILRVVIAVTRRRHDDGADATA